MRLLPEKANTDARVLVLTRSVRAFVDGIAFVVLPAYLQLAAGRPERAVRHAVTQGGLQ